jgi:hypothetical protein
MTSLSGVILICLEMIVSGGLVCKPTDFLDITQIREKKIREKILKPLPNLAGVGGARYYKNTFWEKILTFTA